MPERRPFDLDAFLDKLAGIDGEWELEDYEGRIRHTELKDRYGSGACPIVAVHQLRRDRTALVPGRGCNRDALEIGEDLGMVNQLASEVIWSADRSYGTYRRSLLQACRLPTTRDGLHLPRPPMGRPSC